MLSRKESENKKKEGALKPPSKRKKKKEGTFKNYKKEGEGVTFS